MSSSLCPKCYSEMEVRETTPCFVCGCWHEGENLHEILDRDSFSIYGLPDNTEIVLCTMCYLEDVISNLGDILDELNIRKEEAEEKLRFFDFAEYRISKDKYCTECRKRLALLKVISEHGKKL